MLRDAPRGDYRFLPGISAFSSGTVAQPGHEIVHVTLAAPVPWRAGFTRIERHLREQGRPRTALCGIELRSPAPFTFDGFAKFNDGYRSLLGEWDILVGEDNPIPRTNVAPVKDRAQGPDSIVRHGDTSPEAMREKARFVMGTMQERLRALGAEWSRVTAIDVYTALPIDAALLDEILRPAGPAAIHGIHWYPSRPPINGLEFEMDMRGVARELVLP